MRFCDCRVKVMSVIEHNACCYYKNCCEKRDEGSSDVSSNEPKVKTVVVLQFKLKVFGDVSDGLRKCLSWPIQKVEDRVCSCAGVVYGNISTAGRQPSNIGLSDLPRLMTLVR